MMHPAHLPAFLLGQPVTWAQCPCCGSWLDADDEIAREGDYHHGAALVARYGSMVCHTCAEDHVTCATSGVAITRDEASRDDDGEYYATPELAAEADAEWATVCADRRMMRGWL